MIGKGKGLLIHDLIIIAISIVIAVILVKTDALSFILNSTSNLRFIGMFVAGLFFTSVFTTPPAIAALGEIARANPIEEVALFGALGAVLGDLILFHFIKDKFSQHLIAVIGQPGLGKRFKALLHLRLFRILSLVLGGMVIASPLPDEIGVSLLGFSHIKTFWFIPISFVCNFIGIVVIAAVAQAL